MLQPNRLQTPIIAMVVALTPAATSDALAQPDRIVFGGSYVVDTLSVIDGGLQRGTDVVARADAWVDVDGQALGLNDVTLHGDIIATHGRDFSGERVGAFQTLSNVEAASRPHVYEAWAEWRINEHLAAKAGLIDLNGEFDVQESGALFLNSTHGIGPEFSQSGANGPSIFPMTSAAVVVRATSGRKVLRIGLFDAVSGARHDPRLTAVRVPGTSGALIVAEAEVPIGQWELQAGAWHYTTRFAALDPLAPPVPSRGAYALMDGPVTDKLSAWLRIGTADARANPVSLYFGGGGVLEAGRWHLGLSAAHARTGATARRLMVGTVGARRAETVIELTARRRVLPWVQIQPDVQYVVHPGWNPDTRNALVAGLRLSLNWPGA